ncbi:MAG: transporter suffix domain-containing protein [Syntrophales bacterium]
MNHEKSWKYYLGVSLFIYSFLPLCTVELLFLLPLTASEKASAALIYIGSGEIACISAVALLGKPFVEALKTRIKGFFVRKKPVAPPKPVGKTQHAIGVTLFFLSFLPYPVAEGVLFFGHPTGRDLHYLVAAMLAGDVIFIISLFVLGGEFWERLKKLFEWPGKPYGR